MKRGEFLRSLLALPAIPEIAASLKEVPLPIVIEKCTDCTGKGILHYVSCPNNGNVVYYKPLSDADIQDLYKSMFK